MLHAIGLRMALVLATGTSASLASAVTSPSAHAATAECRWITTAEAERILLEPVKAPTSTPASVAQMAAAQVPGLREVSDCIYAIQRGTIGQVGVTVYRFTTAAQATAQYERLRTSSQSNGSRIVPVRGIGDAAHLANPPALSDGVMVVRKGADVVRLSRIAGPVLKQAIENAPDGERFDLYGLAPLVLGRL
jgi:hypothetical protein